MAEKYRELSNTATGRLLNIFADMNLIASNGNDETIYNVIKKTYPNGDPFLFFMQLARLTYEAQEEIKELPQRSRETHLKAIWSVRSELMKLNVSDSWAMFHPLLSEPIMTGLELTADRLSSASKEKYLNEIEIKSISNEIDELLEMVITIEMEEELRKFLINNINKMKDAVLHYRIYGAKGLKEALENIIGATRIYDIDTLSKTPAPVRAKFIKTFNNVAKMVAFFNDLKGLSGGNFPFLPGPS